MKRLLMMVAGLVWVVAAQAASFDCVKAGTKVEKLICENRIVSSLDENVDLAYLRALERADDRQKVTQEQRDWLKNDRNVCPDTDCLLHSYASREEELNAISTHKCYWLEPPRKDSAGKRPPVESICHALEKNLNQFCDQPPMVCGLKIAPKFSKQFMLPSWKSVENVNPAMIEEFIRAPWMDSSLKKEDKDALWEEERPKIEAAFAKKRLTFSKAQLDLYNLGKAQTVYRLDYGNCQADNPQLKDPAEWGMAIHYAEVKTQHAPEIVRSLFKEYFPLQHGSLNDVFLYEGKVYDFIIFGTVNQATGEGENQMIVNRHERWTNPSNKKVRLVLNNICIFNYQPVQESTK
jgi:uncharacterized protein